MSESSKINKRLKQLYSNQWDDLKTNIVTIADHKNIDHPLLLSVTEKLADEWSKSKVKLMIFGISSNGWGEEMNLYNKNNDEAIELLMKEYDTFYSNGENWRYGHAFWNYYYSFHTIFQFLVEKSTSTIWNNVFKFDEARSEFEEKHFNVILEEVKILKPNLIVVFGSNAGDVLHQRLSGNSVDWDEYAKTYVDTKTKKKRPIYWSVPGNFYPELQSFLQEVIITYHPNARGIAGIKLKLMIEELVAELSKN